MALEGNIQDFGLPDILEFLSSNRKTGVLTLRGREDTASLGFKEGDVVAAAFGRSGIPEQVSRYLVKSGRVTPLEMKHLEDLSTASGLSLEDVLRREGVLSQEGLEELIRYKIQEIVDELFGWKEGTYRFETDAVIYGQSRVKVVVQTSALLLEGMRRIDEWPRIEQTLPTPHIILAKKSKPSLKVSLTPEQARLLTLADGKRTIADLVDATGFGRFRTYHALYDLLEVGLLEKVGQRIPRREPQTRVLPLAKQLGFGLGLAVIAAVLLAVSVGIGKVQSLLLVPWPAPTPPTYLALIQARRIDNIRFALDIYYRTNGRYPPTLAELSRQGYLAPSQIESSRKQELSYRLLPGDTTYVLSTQ